MRAFAQTLTAFGCLIAAGLITAVAATWFDALGVVGLIVFAVIMTHDRERELAVKTTEKVIADLRHLGALESGASR